MWLGVAICGLMWLKVADSGFMWLIIVVVCGYKWF